MGMLPNMLMNRFADGFVQLPQRLVDDLSGEGLQGLRRSLEDQFPQTVHNGMSSLNAGGANGVPVAANQNPNAQQAYPYYPPFNAYYGYGRPLPNPLPLRNVAPSGYRGYAPAQIGPAPYRWYS